MLLPGCASTRSLSKGAAGGQAPYVVLYVLLSFFLLCSLALVLIIFIIQRERKKGRVCTVYLNLASFPSFI